MNLIEEAKRVFEVESNAIRDLSDRVGEEFTRAVEALGQCPGKVIVTGIGKSGLIGRKIAATFSSTGTPSVFLHPAECSHGDLGVLAKNDVVLAISYGGESLELNSLVDYVARKGIPLVAMTGRLESALGQAADITLDIGIKEEVCPLGLAPTTSTTVTLVMGDALAMALMKKKGIQSEDFAEFHPGGSLAKRLTRVRDIMHTGAALPLVREDAEIKVVVAEMTRKDVRGVAGVVDEQGYLIGIITDGDIRRHFEADFKNIERLTARTMMSSQPKTIGADELAEKALFVMEQFKIQNLFAIEKIKVNDEFKPKPVGLLHLQDLLTAKIC